MATPAEAILDLDAQRRAIAASVNTMGVAADDMDTLAELAGKILEIPTGGGDDAYYGRPEDWLPMPTPDDNELYMLFLIPRTEAALCAFTISLVGNTGTYTVELGTVTGGAFAANPAFTQTLASGTKCALSFDYDDWGNETAEGFRQAMIKVSGNILAVYPQSYPSRATYFATTSIVEIAGQLPNCTTFRLTSDSTSTNSESRAWSQTRYFALYGPNKITAGNRMFEYAVNLVSVLALDTSLFTTMERMHYSNHNLRHIPEYNLQNVTGAQLAFWQCYAITRIPIINGNNLTSNVYACESMFRYCCALLELPNQIQYRGNIGQLAEQCYALRSADGLDVSATTVMTSAFSSCFALSRMTIKPGITLSGGLNISIRDCAFSRGALVELFESLPTAVAASTLTITANPGASALTADDKLIATAKGWTITG